MAGVATIGFALVGCSDDDDPVTPLAGTVVIDCNPDGIGGSWTLNIGVLMIGSGFGDSTVVGLSSGEYLVSWGSVVGFQTPPDETKSLAAGGQVSFSGQYTDNTPEGFELIPAGTFTMGSPESELGRS